MILLESEIKVKVMTFYWEHAKIMAHYITMPDGETYCFKQEDMQNNKTYRMQRYYEPKQEVQL